MTQTWTPAVVERAALGSKNMAAHDVPLPPRHNRPVYGVTGSGLDLRVAAALACQADDWLRLRLYMVTQSKR